MAGDSTGTPTSPKTRDQLIAMQGGRRVVERRRDRPGLRHLDRRDHPPASVQVSPRVPAVNPREGGRDLEHRDRSRARPGRTGRAEVRPRPDPPADRQADHRPGRGRRSAPDRRLRPRPLHPGRGARTGQDADGPLAGAVAVPGVQPDPVHARPDAQRHHRHRGPVRGPGHRRAGAAVRARGRSSPT